MVGTRSVGQVQSFPAGDLLRARRKALKLSVRDVAQALNVPEAQLAALERGDFSVFAAEVYARGACLKYARYLGIEREVGERAIWRALTEVRQLVPLHLHTTLTFFQRLAHPHVFIGLLVGGAALVVGGYIVWQVQSFFHLPQVLLLEPSVSEVRGSHVAVAGRAEKGARVTVNGEPMLLSPEADFRTTLSLRPGINVLRVEAENAAGRRRVVERHILVSR